MSLKVVDKLIAVCVVCRVGGRSEYPDPTKRTALYHVLQLRGANRRATYISHNRATSTCTFIFLRSAAGSVLRSPQISTLIPHIPALSAVVTTLGEVEESNDPRIAHGFASHRTQAH